MYLPTIHDNVMNNKLSTSNPNTNTERQASACDVYNGLKTKRKFTIQTRLERTTILVFAESLRRKL